MRIRAWLSSWTFVIAAAVCSTVVHAQPPGGPGGPGGGPFGGGGGLLGLAARDDVQQELQLVDEQKEKVRALTDDMRTKVREEMGSMFQGLQGASDEDRRARFDEIRTKFETINKDMEKKLDGVLLPHQLERLKQIDLQNKMRQRGASALTGGDIAEALNLSDEQRDKLEKRAAEVQEELQTKIKELQADARKKMIDVLTPEQQVQLQKMMGDNFDMQDQGFGGFRGRFNRGGQDGQNGDRRTRSGSRGDDQSKSGKDAAQ
jgi:Spy/CpxP family protein refolding chaperone